PPLCGRATNVFTGAGGGATAASEQLVEPDGSENPPRRMLPMRLDGLAGLRTPMSGQDNVMSAHSGRLEKDATPHFDGWGVLCRSSSSARQGFSDPQMTCRAGQASCMTVAGVLNSVFSTSTYIRNRVASGRNTPLSDAALAGGTRGICISID